MRLINNSWLFVDFFFVLSGFIITHSLSEGITSPRGLIAFAIRRFGRLWPTHFVIIVLMIAYQFSKAPPGPLLVMFNSKTYAVNDFLISLSYFMTFLHSLPGFFQLGIGAFVDINPPSWSISVEYWIYLLFGIILLYAKHFKNALLSILIIASSLMLLLIDEQIGSSLEYGILRCAYGFFVGHMVYLCYSANSFDLNHWRLGATIIEGLVVLGSAMFVILTGPVPQSLFAPAIFGLMVYVFAFEAGGLSRLMMVKPIRYLGTLSYTIYICHALVALALADGLKLIQQWMGVTYSFQREMYWEMVTVISFPSTVAANFNVLCYIFITIGFAALLSHWVEIPCRDWVNRFAKAYAGKPQS